jgi:hypothetical protein
MEIPELPVLFKTHLVERILEGVKTQTRRPVADARGVYWDHAGYRPSVGLDGRITWDPPGICPPNPRGPLGQVGDRLWVRETWQALVLKSNYHEMGRHSDGTPEYEEWWEAPWRRAGLLKARAEDKTFSVVYRAGADKDLLMEIEPWGWRSSLHMYRWACRLVLEVTELRVERLQEMSVEDAFKEGIEPVMCCAGFYPATGEGCGCMGQPVEDPRHAFADSWDKTYAKKGAGWADNPWVWVADFKVVEKPEPSPKRTPEEKERFNEQITEEFRAAVARTRKKDA